MATKAAVCMSKRTQVHLIRYAFASEEDVVIEASSLMKKASKGETHRSNSWAVDVTAFTIMSTVPAFTADYNRGSDKKGMRTTLGENIFLDVIVMRTLAPARG